ncbi:MAG: hypothetical protein LBU15_03585 [Rickettsiales bacterium]|jgi:hypothetical protein|nr:hypothetical protein [Rickettsiales bacterium]
MTDSNNKDDDPVVVEEDPIVDVSDGSGTSGVGESKGGGGSKYITIGVSVVAAIFIYIFFFSSDKSDKDAVDTRAIVKDTDVGSRMNTAVTVDNIDNLADIGYRGDVYVDDKNKGLLELPELPQLPDNIVANIEEELKDIKRTEAAKEGVFTKEEVDQMISNRLKSFEDEMKKAKGESEKLAKELERKKEEE